MTKRVVLYCRNSPGPTDFFDPLGNKYLNGRLVTELVESDVVKLEIRDHIPYIILLHVTSGRFYDTTKGICISETEAKRLTDSNIATLKIVLDDSSFVLNETDGAYTSNSSDDCEKVAREMKKDELKEKLLLGATAAGGTTAVAAGAASVPFALGFTSGGVAAGSAAAAIQASIGSVAAGSGFAAMQSIAATTIIGTALPLAVAGAAVVGTVASGVLLHSHLKKKKERKRRSAQEAELRVKYEKRMFESPEEELLGGSDEELVEDSDIGQVKLPDYEDPPAYSP
ncbi:hypothetical protein ACHWQZ_G005871 [Mnemiopsis leidyi]